MRAFELPLSRTEIGTFLGLRLETVSRQMRALRETGVIEVLSGRQIRILDPVRLGELAEQPSP
jgi:CRP/FNR family transcriptional regulator